MALNRARVAQDISLTDNLDYFVQIEFFDSAQPAVVLRAEALRVPIGATTAQLQALVVARGATIRTALAAAAAANVAVPVGTVVTVP